MSLFDDPAEPAAVAAGATVISVSELNRRVRAAVERALPLTWVSGEMSNLRRYDSGHWYFTLKDAAAQVDCVMFRHKAQHIDWQPADGMKVEVRALATVYEARGKYQLNVEAMRRAGLGALYEAYERMIKSDVRYRFVIDVPKKEIYDLEADPAEAHNLGGGKPAERTEALAAGLRALPGPPALPDRKTTDDEAKALRALGYIGSGGEYALGRAGMDPKDFVPLYNQLNEVRALCDARRFAEAVPIYERLLAAFPRSSILACELGLVQMALGNAAEAASHLERALELDAGNSHALLGMANLALGRGDTSGAERRLLDVLELDPDDVEANFNLGALYYQNLAQPEKAVRYWQRFLELQPGDPEAPRIRELVAKMTLGINPDEQPRWG